MTNRKFPVSWLNVKLSEICQILDYKRVPVNNAERNQRLAGKNQDDIYPYYGATGIVGYIDGYLFDGEYLLVGEDGAPFLEPFKNKAYIVSGKFWVNNHAHIIEPLINNKFLLHYLNVFDYSNSVTGTTRLKLNQQALKEINCLIPPLNEQHRIVTKIEELFSKIDKGVESLQKAKELLVLYRQSLLKHAFEGKLTEQWRKENPDKVVPADELLEQIKQARESRYQQQLEEWESAVKLWESEGKKGKKPSKPKKPENIRRLESELLNQLPEIPKSWIWCFLGDISDISGGLTKNSKKQNSTIKKPFLRVANVYANELKLEDMHYIGLEETELKRVLVEKDDLLIVEGNGSIEHIGRVAKWDGSIKECVHQNHLIKARVYKTVVNPDFILHFLLSKTGRNLIIREASSTSGLHTLNLSKIASLKIPLCSIEESKEILKAIQEKLSSIDSTTNSIFSEITRSVSLKQSILKKAFSGQLVPQDPNDEPASVLLERIKAEKARAGCN